MEASEPAGTLASGASLPMRRKLHVYDRCQLQQTVNVTGDHHTANCPAACRRDKAPDVASHLEIQMIKTWKILSQA